MTTSSDDLARNGTEHARLTRRAALLRAGQGGLTASALGVLGLGAANGASAQAAPEAAPCTCGMAAGACACEPQEPILAPATLETLPESTPETAGRLRRLTDYDRGPWLDTGEGWVSIRGHVSDVRAFGATGDGETDDWVAFQTALEAMTSLVPADSTEPAGHTLLVPPGVYRLGQSLVVTRAVRIAGSGAGGRFSDAILRFDAGIAGIVIAPLDAGLTGENGRRGDGTIVERLRIEAATVGEAETGGDVALAEGGPATPAHGVWLRTRAAVLHCAVSGFGGDGICVEGPLEADAVATAGWHVEGCEVTGCGGHGLGVSRGSGGAAVLLVAAGNGGRGIADDSERGNAYLQCRAADNGEGAFAASGALNQSLFLGCDGDAGQSRSAFSPATLVVGGVHGAGFEGGNAWTTDGSRMFLRAQVPGTGEPALPTAPTLHLQGSEGQTEPHLLVESSQDVRLAEIDSLGRLFLGPLEPATSAGSEGGPAGGAEAILLNLIHPESGRAGIRWVVPGETTGFVAQAQAFVEEAGPDAPAAAAGARLTFQTAAAGASADTLTLREGRAGIGTTAPAPAAILDLASTSQGFLPPRLTGEQRDAIAAPPEGLTLYNITTKHLNLYDGAAWRELAFTEAAEDEVTGG